MTTDPVRAGFTQKRPFLRSAEKCFSGVGAQHQYEIDVGIDCDTKNDFVNLVDHDHRPQFPDGTKCSGPPKSFPDPDDCQMFYYCCKGCDVLHITR